MNWEMEIYAEKWKIIYLFLYQLNLFINSYVLCSFDIFLVYFIIIFGKNLCVEK